MREIVRNPPIAIASVRRRHSGSQVLRLLKQRREESHV